MKSDSSYPRLQTGARLMACLAAMAAVSVPTLRAETAEEIQKLHDEVAALRERLSHYEGSNAPATPTVVPVAAPAPAPAANALPTDAGVEALSPFQVVSERDNGYLRTNSATATRIGMEIQKIPMAVSVVSSDFIRDTGMRSLTDILGFTPGTSGDPKFNTNRPSNNATPQGTFTIRGFPVNIILRDGLLMYSTKYQADNTDRVEIIKGPAAVFFGEGYPGGVINFVTKTASLGKLPSEISYTFGSDNTNRGLIDENHVLSDKAALRVVTGWENSKGDRAFEFTKRFDFTPSIVLDPFANGKLKITANTIYLKEKYNENLGDWIYPSGWFAAYQSPSAALMTAAGLDPANPASVAAYRTRIQTSVANYQADLRKSAGNNYLPTYTSIQRGAYYTDKNGNRIHDEGFNYMNRGSFDDNEQTTSTFGVDMTPFEWLSVRYALTQDNTTFTDQEGNNVPNADGTTFNAASGYNGAGYFRKTRTHQLDAVFKLDAFGVKNKLLVGYLLQNLRQQYLTLQNQGTPDYHLIPGYNYPAVNPGTSLTPGNETNMVPVGQYIRDRNGNILSAQQVYANWDPGFQVQPDENKLNPGWSNPIDGYPAQYNAWYVNYSGSAFSDRLTLLGGFRQETYRQAGQALTANFPWFSPPPYAFADQTTYPPGAYNYSPSYASTNFLTQTGNSYMGGASFEVKKGINVYTSVSQTFRFNSLTPLGGFLYHLDATDTNFQTLVNTVLAANGGSFNYKYYNGGSTTITSVADALAALNHEGAGTQAPNEVGKNIEIGAKLALWDDRLVATFSLFRADRNNQLVEDFQHQATEPFNYGNLAGVAAGSRTLRWRSVAHNRVEGTEAETIWTPMRNFQLLANASWYWTAKTISDPSVAATNINHDIYFNNRIENVPEYRVNFFGKYTLTDTFLRGLSIGFGGRYSSETNISRSVDWNPDLGGLTAGNFVVFNGNLAYPFEISGYKVITQLVVDNIFDKKYIDGGTSGILAPTTNWSLTTTLRF
ncbi:MAG: hypothetical protein JWM88_2522 [Verrucomicrobia bacterium]|nr:hypothetical protein [Verrucomicrobiota bacterium]